MVLLRLPREAGNKGGSQSDIRDLPAELCHQLPDLLIAGPPSHALKNGITGVLDGDIQIVADLLFILYGLDQLVGDLLGITVLETDPLDPRNRRKPS